MWNKVFQTEKIASAKALRLDPTWCSPGKTRSLWLEPGEQGFQKVVEDEIRDIREVVDHRGPYKSFVSVFIATKMGHKKQPQNPVI